jgi:hypothetical protein
MIASIALSRPKPAAQFCGGAACSFGGGSCKSKRCIALLMNSLYSGASSLGAVSGWAAPSAGCEICGRSRSIPKGRFVSARTFSQAS